MSNQKIRITDPIQLQQKIIYFKAELAKYKNKVKDFENNYYYSKFKKLKEDNLQLMGERNELYQQLQTSSEKYEKRLNILSSQLKSLEKQEETLISTQSNQKNEIEKLKTEIVTYVDKISKLTESKNDLRIKIDFLNKELFSLNEQKETIKKLQTIQEDYKLEINKLTKEKQTNLKRISDLEKQANNFKEKNIQFDANIKKLEKNHTDEALKQKSLTAQIESQQNEINEYKKIKDQIKKKDVELQKEKQNLASILDELEMEREKVKDIELQFLQSQSEKESLKSNLSYQQHEIENLKKEKLTYEDKIFKLTDNNKLLNSKIESLNNELLSLKGQKDETIGKFKMLQDNYEAQIKELNKEKQLLSSKVEQFNEEYIKVKDLNFHDSHLKLEEASMKQQQNEQTIIALKEEISYLKSTTSQLEDELSESQKQNKDMCAKLENIQKTDHIEAALIRTNEGLLEEIGQILDNQKKMITKIEELQLNNIPHNPSHMTSENIDLAILTQLESQFKEILERTFDYEGQLDSKLIIVNDLENKLQDLTNEIEELQNSIHSED